MSTGNKAIPDLPPIPTPDGGSLYITRDGIDYKVDTGGAYGLATLGSDGKLPTGQFPAVTSLPWSGISGKPTTLAGYGITDGLLKTGDTITGGLTFSGGLDINRLSMAKHITLETGYGFGITTLSLNYNAPNGAAHTFRVNNIDVLSVDGSGTHLGDGSTIAGQEVGYRNIPFTVKNTSFTLDNSYRGQAIGKTDTTLRLYTIPSGVFVAGDELTIVNDASSANISISQGSGMSLYLSGNTTAATRTVSPRSLAKVYFTSGSTAYVSGQGVS